MERACAFSNRKFGPRKLSPSPTVDHLPQRDRPAVRKVLGIGWESRVIETRLIIAYLMLFLMAASFAGLVFYMTRDRRAYYRNRRAHRRAKKADLT